MTFHKYDNMYSTSAIESTKGSPGDMDIQNIHTIVPTPPLLVGCLLGMGERQTRKKRGEGKGKKGKAEAHRRTGQASV